MTIDWVKVTPDEEKIKIDMREEQKLCIITLPILNSGENWWSQLLEYVKTVPEPWLYDTLYDQRHYKGYGKFEDAENFARDWVEICQGRDAGRRTCAVSPPIEDYITRRYAEQAYQQLSPQREVQLFFDFDEAYAWITRPR